MPAKNQPEEVLPEPTPDHSKLFARSLTAIAVIGGTSVLGIITLAVVENPIPDVLQNLAVGSLTALAGMLSRPPTE